MGAQNAAASDDEFGTPPIWNHSSNMVWKLSGSFGEIATCSSNHLLHWAHLSILLFRQMRKLSEQLRMSFYDPLRMTSTFSVPITTIWDQVLVSFAISILIRTCRFRTTFRSHDKYLVTSYNRTIRGVRQSWRGDSIPVVVNTARSKMYCWLAAIRIPSGKIFSLKYRLFVFYFTLESTASHLDISFTSWKSLYHETSESWYWLLWAKQ